MIDCGRHRSLPLSKKLSRHRQIDFEPGHQGIPKYRQGNAGGQKTTLATMIPSEPLSNVITPLQDKRLNISKLPALPAKSKQAARKMSKNTDPIPLNHGWVV
jgi:hypothetical protein